MSGWSTTRRLDLVQQLRFDAGVAESNSERVRTDFWPIPEHLRALEPEVSLIVGDRGSGKTKLVQAALDGELRRSIVRRVPSLRMPSGAATWLCAYPNPVVTDPPGFKRFAENHRQDKEPLQQLFFAYAVRALAASLDDESTKRLTTLLGCPAADPEVVLSAMQSAGPHPLQAFDELDRKLLTEDRWMFVAYDELDTLVIEDRQALSALIRGLLGFWITYARRWRRIKPKIFLRTDFYTHRGDVAGADLAKLAANRVELHWSDKNLYGALIKPLANLSKDWRSYCELGRIDFDDDYVLGAVPRLPKAESAKPFFDRLIGEFMGANSGKGFTYKWILDHVRDGNRRASPRSLVQLIVQAAEIEAQSPKATGVQLLHHTSLRNALDRVSRLHVEGVRHEFPWLGSVAECLKADREVPWQRKELEKLLKHEWSARSAAYPADSPGELIERMIELGIVRDRKGGKLDVPDLFLAGLGLRRKGGVARGERSRRTRRS